jgi:hypothetical protein
LLSADMQHKNARRKRIIITKTVLSPPSHSLAAFCDSGGAFCVSVVTVGTAKPSSSHGASARVLLSVVIETCGGAGCVTPSAGDRRPAGQYRRSPVCSARGKRSPRRAVQQKSLLQPWPTTSSVCAAAAATPCPRPGRNAKARSSASACRCTVRHRCAVSPCR